MKSERLQEPEGLMAAGEAAAGPLPIELATSPESTPGRQWTLRGGIYGLLLASVAGMFAGLPDEAVAALAVVAMLVLMAMKMPVGLAMAGPGLLGITAVIGWPATVGVMQRTAYNTTATWSLTVLPMFIFMGVALWQSGVTERLYFTTRQWMGGVPGGLAIGTNFAGAGLAAVSGSTIASTYALARIGVPEMLRAGYDRRLAVGAILMAGTGGQLIPPSIMLVIYAGIAEVPVGPQLLAGVGPGVALALAYGLMLFFLSTINNGVLSGSGSAKITASWRERFASLKGVWTLPMLTFVVLGGMFMGWFTATEAGAVGAFGAVLLLLALRRRQSLPALGRALSSTITSLGAIFFLMVGALILSQLFALSGIADGFAEAVVAMGFGRVRFLLLMLLVYLVLGTVMDPLTMMLLTVPVLIPTLNTLDISLIWFGVFAVFLGELAVITPPVGILTFIVHSIVQDPEVNLGTKITLGDTFQAVLWFLPISLLVVALLILYPDIALWIPDMMTGS